MVPFKAIVKGCLVGIVVCVIYVLIFATSSIDVCSRNTDCNCKNNENKNIHSDLNGNSHSLCILVPYRNRFEELQQFVPRLTTFLQKKSIRHYIFIINQVDSYRFNRASLLNAGFLLSEKNLQGCDYVALHDVDLIPQNEELSYSYPETGVFHVAAPGLHPKYDYENFVGGILLITRTLFRQVNGLSNNYWGWGLEDDEFFARLSEAGVEIKRPEGLSTGKQDTFYHDHPSQARQRDSGTCYNQYEITRKRDRLTGLDTVQFSLTRQQTMSIDGIFFTVFNIALHCNTSATPWCDCSNAPKDAKPNKNLTRDKDVIVPIMKKVKVKKKYQN